MKLLLFCKKSLVKISFNFYLKFFNLSLKLICFYLYFIFYFYVNFYKKKQKIPPNHILKTTSKIKYELKLVASDSLNENFTTIIIHVRDVNDLPPVFPQTLYERTLNEELKAPFTIIQVRFDFKFFFSLFILYLFYLYYMIFFVFNYCKF